MTVETLDTKPNTPLTFVRLCLRHWRVLLSTSFIVTAAITAVTLLLTPLYTARMTFVPETRSTRLSGAAALASQLGVSLGAAVAGESPQFYADLARSRSILTVVLVSKYPRHASAATVGDSATLLDLLDVEGKTAERRVDNGLHLLESELVHAAVNQNTGVVTLSVDMPSPQLAAAVATRIVQQLQEFNVRTRQSQAGARRRFVEARTAEAERALREAEDRLESFLERNRQWQSSPQLQFEHERLGRRVQVQQEVYLTLSRELETARIEEVNDTPLLTVVDSADVPQRRSKPRRKALALFAVALGCIAGLGAASVVDYVQRLRTEAPESLTEVRLLWRQALSALRFRKS